MSNETNPGAVAEDMQRGADALRYLLNWADTNTRVKTIMKTFTSDGVTTQDRLERLWTALSLAAQSQPAATVQEVGREAELIALVKAIAVEAQKAGLDVMHMLHSSSCAALAALTAEPAAKAGDAGVQGEDGDFMEKMVAKRRYLLLASYCGGEANCSDTRPCDDCLAMCNVFKVDDANPTYERELGPAPVAPPSPQPDMGSGEANHPTEADIDMAALFYCSRMFGSSKAEELKRLRANLDDEEAPLDSLVYLFMQHRLAALSPPASQSVESLLREIPDEVFRRVAESKDVGTCRYRVADLIRSLPHKEEATPAEVVCPSCDNTGVDLYDGTEHDCQICAGRGVTPATTATERGRG